MCVSFVSWFYLSHSTLALLCFIPSHVESHPALILPVVFMRSPFQMRLQCSICNTTVFTACPNITYFCLLMSWHFLTTVIHKSFFLSSSWLRANSCVFALELGFSLSLIILQLQTLNITHLLPVTIFSLPGLPEQLTGSSCTWIQSTLAPAGSRKLNIYCTTQNHHCLPGALLVVGIDTSAMRVVSSNQQLLFIDRSLDSNSLVC